MPSLRRDDDVAIRGWLAGLEAEAESKAAPAPIGYVGGGYSTGAGYGYLGIAMDGLAPTPADGPTYLNVAVAACLGWLDRNFPVADLHVIQVTKQGGGPKIDDHAFIALMDRPNAIDDFHSFWQSFLLSDVVDGNTFFVKIGNRVGIHSLWWVPPWDVNIVASPTRDSERPIDRFEIRVGGEMKSYPPEEIIHIKDGKDPNNPFRGLAKLKAGLRSVSTIDRAELYTQTLMRNMGAIPYMLSPSNPNEQIHPDNVDSLRNQFGERQTGYSNGKPFISTQGLKLDRLGLSPEEMALDTIRDFPVAAVCALIGTPALAVGLPDASKGKGLNNNDYETAIKAAWDNGLIPRQARAAEAFDRQCPELIHPTRERLKWDYSHVKALQEDWNKKVEGLVKAVGGPIMTKNEARDMIHLDPVEGGHEINKPAPSPGLHAPQVPPEPGAARG